MVVFCLEDEGRCWGKDDVVIKGGVDIGVVVVEGWDILVGF